MKASERVGSIPFVEKQISRIVLGTPSLSPPNKKNSDALLDEYRALGGNAIEMAHSYGDGDCERVVGRWMKERGVRDQFVIITKGGHPFDARSRMLPECVEADLHESLARLQTDYIDVYMLHRDDPSKPVNEIVDCLNKLHKAGKIKAFGGSNWTTARLEAANKYAKESGQIPFVVSSPHFSLGVPKRQPWPGCLAMMPEDVPWYEKQQNLSVIVWSPLARGFFAGRYSPTQLDDDGVVETWFTDENFARLERARSLAKQKNVSSGAIAMAYVLAQKFKPFTAVGPHNRDELLDIFQCVDVDLSETEMKDLVGAPQPTRS